MSSEMIRATDRFATLESHLPCRITVSMKGAEWFLYNRTPSYDAILQHLGVVPTSASFGSSATDEKLPQGDSTEMNEKPASGGVLTGKTDWLREALPIDIRCKTGSIIFGNRSTPTILIAGFDSVAGSYAAVKVWMLLRGHTIQSS